MKLLFDLKTVILVTELAKTYLDLWTASHTHPENLTRIVIKPPQEYDWTRN